MDPIQQYGAPGTTDADLDVIALHLNRLEEALSNPNLTAYESAVLNRQWSGIMNLYMGKLGRGRNIINDQFQWATNTPDQQVQNRLWEAENQYFKSPAPVQSGLMSLPLGSLPPRRKSAGQ